MPARKLRCVAHADGSKAVELGTNDFKWHCTVYREGRRHEFHVFDTVEEAMTAFQHEIMNGGYGK